MHIIHYIINFFSIHAVEPIVYHPFRRKNTPYNLQIIIHKINVLQIFCDHILSNDISTFHFSQVNSANETHLVFTNIEIRCYNMKYLTVSTI